MSGKTAGQAFREALHERWAARGHCIDTRPWDALPEIDREDMDAAAKAATVTAWRLLDEARAERDEARAERDAATQALDALRSLASRWVQSDQRPPGERTGVVSATSAECGRQVLAITGEPE